MLGRSETDVLVVGAGPVGLFTALDLAERGVSVEIIDEEWRTAAHSYAAGLHPRTLQLLDRMGLADGLLEQARKIERIVFYDGRERKSELDLSVASAEFPFLAVLPQSTLETALERSLGERGVQVRWNRALSALDEEPKRVKALIDVLGKATGGYAVATTDWVIERSVSTRASFVVGADGHRSTVRRHLGIDYEAAGETELFSVFEFDSDAEVGNEALIGIDRSTVNAVWPLPDGRIRMSFQLLEGREDLAERRKSRLAVQVGRRAFPDLDRQSLEVLIAERIPWFSGRIGEIHWSLVVRFERRLAKSFGRGRIWLAGDSAHLAGPVGVQSMNVGFLEGHDLAARLARILAGDAEPETLAEYGETWRAEWRGLLGLEGEPAPPPEAERWILANAARLPALIPASGDHHRSLLAALGA